MRTYDIEAKPTFYNGIEYRSRLEARWAVFFDSLKIKHEYEKQSYLIGNKYYLPDFWLKNWIIEIKPNHPTSEEYYKAKSVSIHNPIAILAGLPNPDVMIYMFKNDKQVFVYPSKIEIAYCFARGIDARKWTALKMLSKITNKRNFGLAFEKAERYQF